MDGFMTNSDSNSHLSNLHGEIAEIIAKFGVIKTLMAVILHLATPKPRPPDASQLPDYLKKDVGIAVDYKSAVDWKNVKLH